MPTSRTRGLRKIKYTEILSSICAALTLSSLLNATPALACATCGHMVSNDWQTQGINTKPGFAVDLSYDYINQNQMRLGANKASPADITSFNTATGNPEAEVLTRNQIVNLGIDYTSVDWGISLLFPYLDRYHTTNQNGYGVAPLNTSQSATLADARVLGRYSGFSGDRSGGLLLGIKLPTGPTDINFADGTPLDRSLQPGTASTDFIVGGYQTGQINQFGWFVQGTLQHAIATRGDYRPGDTINLTSGIRYAKFGQQITPMLQLNLVHRERDSGINALPAYSGGNLVYLSPGLSVRLGDGTSAYGFVQLPIYQYVNGLQLVPTSTVTVGIRHAFD